MLEFRIEHEQPGEKPIKRKQGTGGNNPANKGVIAADHRILDRIGQDDDQDEIVDRHLAKLSLSQESESSQEKEIDHCGLAGDDQGTKQIWMRKNGRGPGDKHAITFLTHSILWGPLTSSLRRMGCGMSYYQALLVLYSIVLSVARGGVMPSLLAHRSR